MTELPQENPYIYVVNRGSGEQRLSLHDVKSIAGIGSNYEQALFELGLSKERAKADRRYSVHPDTTRRASDCWHIVNAFQQAGPDHIEGLAKRRAKERLDQTLYRRK